MIQKPANIGALIGLASILILAPGISASQTSPISPCASVHQWGQSVSFSDCSFNETSARSAVGARAFLDQHAESFGLDLETSTLEVVQFKHGLASSHTRFRQKFQGLPIFGTLVSVHQDTDGQVRTVHRSTHSGRASSSSATPTVSMADAERAARLAAGKSVGRNASLRLPTVSELVWFPVTAQRLTLAWQLTVFSDDPLGDFLTVVDANNGALLFQDNRISFGSESGFVYVPNPYQTSGSGTDMNDSNDATNATLDGERINVPLFGLDAGTGLIKGEFVDLSTLNSTSLPDVDADEPSRIYLYDRNDPRFEQVVIYNAIDQIQRHFHFLGFDDDSGTPNGIRDFPTLANAHWFSDDQSFYSTGDDAVHFGDGGVDDGEDADIIAHEYGHAVQHDQNASWGGGEMGAMGEAFGDYLAMSFYFDAGDATYQLANNPCVGEWDATSYSGSNPPCLRRTDGNKIYPDDLVGQVHADGEIWSRALWDIRAVLGGPTTDQLVLEHHFSLPAGATMPVAALEMIAADGLLNSGANESTLRLKFCDRGILTGGNCQPALAAPTITFPTGGEVLNPGSNVNVMWDTNGASASATYTVSYSDQCSTINSVFSDDMESGSGNWAVSHADGSLDWILGTDGPYSGSSAWFATDPGTISDQYLDLASPLLVPANGIMSVWHNYNTESTFDGGVMEISADGGGTWTDLGASITQNGYSGTISTTFSSPIGGQDAFTGTSGGYVETLVDLGSWAGQNVQIRFRMASDVSVSAVGWHVDDINIIASAPDTVVGTSAAGATSMSWTVPAVQGDDYCVRVQGQAAAHSDAPLVTSSIFSVGATSDIFADGFESGGTTMWNATVGGPPGKN